MRATPIIIEKNFDAPVAKVWKALTDAGEMKKWYFDIPEFKPVEGLEFEFLAGDDKKKFLHKCKIKIAVPNKTIAYTWRYDEYEGESLVTFEVTDEGSGKTKLILTHSGLENFPENVPELDRENFVTGWEEIIGKSLKEYLSN